MQFGGASHERFDYRDNDGLGRNFCFHLCDHLLDGQGDTREVDLAARRGRRRHGRRVGRAADGADVGKRRVPPEVAAPTTAPSMLLVFPAHASAAPVSEN
jgi:hypothetical protein